MRPVYLLISLFTAGAILAADESTPAQPGILLEPSFAAHQIHYPVAGARKTLLVPAYPTESGIKVIRSSTWEEEQLNWEKVLPPALERARHLAEEAPIEWIRDDHEVVLYGMIETDEPFISGILFTDAFLDRVRSRLGDSVLAIVPNRTSIYVFPKFGNKLDDYAASLRETYRDSPLKVSLEIFELSDTGVRATGQISEG